MTETMPNREKQDMSQNFSILGLMIALLAFSMSVTTPWLLDAFAPPPVPIEDIAIEKALSIKEKIKAAVTGAEKQEIISVKEELKHWTEYWPLIVILVALAGIMIGTIGFVKDKNRWIGGTAIGFGITAIVAQYALMAFGALLLILLIWAILASMGGGI